MKMGMMVVVGLVCGGSFGAAQSSLERVGIVRLGRREPEKTIPIPIPPPEYRTVGDVVNDINRADYWMPFKGRVDGIIEPGKLLVSRINQRGNITTEVPFQLINFPVAAVRGDHVEGRAKDLGLHLLTNGPDRQWVTLLDYGIPWTPPSAIQPPREKGDLTAVEKDLKLLKWQRDQASVGLPSAQCSLGLRYLRGDGVPQDKTLARTWLEKSAGQGNAEATAALAKFPAN